MIALKEWKKLDNTIQSQLKKKLQERLDVPQQFHQKWHNQ
jgi:mRNA-degrading endonuclease RelE of RelBE toxin-antitoxin system